MSQSATICWTDIPVVDLDRAIVFYSAVLGETVTKEGEGDFVYGLLPHANDRVAGCLCRTTDNEPSRQGPLIYLNVTGRLDEAILAVSETGGSVLQAKHAIGPHGFRAIVLDSEGNRIALHSPSA